MCVNLWATGMLSIGFPHAQPARDGGVKSTGCPHGGRPLNRCFSPQIAENPGFKVLSGHRFFLTLDGEKAIYESEANRTDDHEQANTKTVEIQGIVGSGYCIPARRDSGDSRQTVQEWLSVPRVRSTGKDRSNEAAAAQMAGHSRRGMDGVVAVLSARNSLPDAWPGTGNDPVVG